MATKNISIKDKDGNVVSGAVDSILLSSHTFYATDGTLDVSSNGSYDVNKYARVSVNVATGESSTTPASVSSDGTCDASQRLVIEHNLGSRKILVVGMPKARLDANSSASNPVEVANGTLNVCFVYITPDAIPSDMKYWLKCTSQANQPTFNYDLTSLGFGVAVHEPITPTHYPFLYLTGSIGNYDGAANGGVMVDEISDNSLRIAVRANGDYRWVAYKLG